ncbi:hypothetical protein DFJ74DRAFT_38905, partial [Hyaloraphidium curvatum]
SSKDAHPADSGELTKPRKRDVVPLRPRDAAQERPRHVLRAALPPPGLSRRPRDPRLRPPYPHPPALPPRLYRPRSQTNGQRGLWLRHRRLVGLPGTRPPAHEGGARGAVRGRRHADQGEGGQHEVCCGDGLFRGGGGAGQEGGEGEGGALPAKGVTAPGQRRYARDGERRTARAQRLTARTTDWHC